MNCPSVSQFRMGQGLEVTEGLDDFFLRLRVHRARSRIVVRPIREDIVRALGRRIVDEEERKNLKYLL
jgi:hypothetical protein